MAFVPFWYILIAILWTGFFVLEGFDMGVGMLNRVIGRDEAGTRTVISTIGPLWDGNEVWLIVAGAATFAAFPDWYATWFSGLYLALVLLLAALIVRGVSFEYRDKRDSSRWRLTWSWLLAGGSLLAPLLIGIALGDLLHGLPIAANHEYTGSFWDLLTPYGVFVGVTLVAICLLHGSIFVAMKTTGDVRLRADRLARRIAPVTALFVLAFIGWTHVTAGRGGFLTPVELLAALAVLAAWAMAGDRREGLAFTATTVTIALCIISLFVDLYPDVMISSTNRADSLTVHNSASPPYSLKVMTVVALIFLPVVLLYQGWTYYVFRRRITDDIYRTAPTTPRPAVSAAIAMASGRRAGQSGASDHAGAAVQPEGDGHGGAEQNPPGSPSGSPVPPEPEPGSQHPLAAESRERWRELLSGAGRRRSGSGKTSPADSSSRGRRSRPRGRHR
jgi:cytochrome bd ubiquinol oxidase subunit II